MGDDQIEQIGQREFDPRRDAKAVKKMKKWDVDSGSDPAMAGLGGEPWWKSIVKRKDKEKKPEQETTSD